MEVADSDLSFLQMLFNYACNEGGWKMSCQMVNGLTEK